MPIGTSISHLGEEFCDSSVVVTAQLPPIGTPPTNTNMPQLTDVSQFSPPTFSIRTDSQDSCHSCHPVTMFDSVMEDPQAQPPSHSSSCEGPCLDTPMWYTPPQTPPHPSSEINALDSQVSFPPDSLYVPGIAHGQPTLLLLGTGASVTAISSSFFSTITSRPSLQPSTLPSIRTVSGENLPVLGQVQLLMLLDNKPYEFTVLVIDNLTYPVVLGRDFLMHYGFVIDLQAHTLRLSNGSPISLQRTPTSNMGEPVSIDSTTVHAYATYILPPMTKSVIPVTPNIPLPAGCTGLVEPDSRLVERYHICGASQLVSLSPDFTFPIRVLNPTNKPVTIYRRTNMGLFTPSASAMSAITTDDHTQTPPPSTASASPIPVDLSWTFVCPRSILTLVNDTKMLGLPWHPHSKLVFSGRHQRAIDCTSLSGFLHLGGRYYLSLQSQNLTFHNRTDNSLQILPLTPLTIYHFPCDLVFATQPIGFGACPSRLSFHVPIFTQTQFHYIPWDNSHDNSTLTLHYQSLNFTPLHFDNTTLQSLDHTFQLLDGKFVTQLTTLRRQISRLHPVTKTRLNDFRTYVAFPLAILNTIFLICLRCSSPNRQSSSFVSHLISRSSNQTSLMKRRARGKQKDVSDVPHEFLSALHIDSSAVIE